jgi:glutamyl/glutaminyl-tRNA synthetase
MEQTKPKAKRRLKSLDFSNSDAAVALVGPSVGGPANGIPTLLVKSVNWSEDQVEKAAKIRVTMEIGQFLQTFYGLYHDDAEVLARALGFDTSKESDELDIASYEDYINSKVEAIEVLKSLYESESISETLSSLTPEQYLSMLTDQAKLEKAFKKIDKEKNSAVAPVAAADEGSTEAVAKAEQSDEKTEAKVEPSETVNKGKSMTKEVKAVAQEVTVEMVEKSAFESIQKQMEDQKVELQKALDLVKAFEAEKKEAVRKARFEQVKGAVKDEAKAEVLFKAVGLVEDESEFQAVVKALSELQALADKSDLFVEKGVQIEAEAPKESAVARVLKSRHAGK